MMKLFVSAATAIALLGAAGPALAEHDSSNEFQTMVKSRGTRPSAYDRAQEKAMAIVADKPTLAEGGPVGEYKVPGRIHTQAIPPADWGAGESNNQFSVLRERSRPTAYDRAETRAMALVADKPTLAEGGSVGEYAVPGRIHTQAIPPADWGASETSSQFTVLREGR